MNVLVRLDESRLPPPGIQEPYATLSGLGAMMKQPNNPLAEIGSRGIREDKDHALAWAKMYGKGRVFYLSLSHRKAAFANPDVPKMYLEGIKWRLGFSEGSTASDLSKIDIRGVQIAAVQKKYRLHPDIDLQLKWMGPMDELPPNLGWVKPVTDYIQVGSEAAD